MKKYRYDKLWPWDIIFKCEPSNSTISLSNCNARLKYGSCNKHKCFYRMSAIKQRFKDMTTKDHMGIMFGCLSCRYCVFFHKEPRTIKKKHFECRKHDPVPVGKIDTFQCEKFLLKKYIRCPYRNELIHCNECLWDYHTEQDYCKNCEVFSCASTTRQKLKLKHKSQLKKKPKLKLKKKPVLKLRRKK